MKPRKEHYRGKLPHFQQPGQWYSVTFTLAGAMPKGAMDRYSQILENAHYRLEELQKQQPEGGLSRVVGFPKFGDTSTWESRRPGEADFPKSDDTTSTLESRRPDILLAEAKKEYQIALQKYRMAYDKFLNKSALSGINLSKEDNRKIIEDTLRFWEGKRLTSHAWCIMSNHVHWIITVFEKELETEQVSDFPESDDPSTLESQRPAGKPVYLQDILHSVKLFTARRININEKLSGQLWEHESFETTIRDNRHFMNVVNYVVQNPVSAGLVNHWTYWPGTYIEPELMSLF
jgi:putative transposase